MDSEYQSKTKTAFAYSTFSIKLRPPGTISETISTKATRAIRSTKAIRDIRATQMPLEKKIKSEKISSSISCFPASGILWTT